MIFLRIEEAKFSKKALKANIEIKNIKNAWFCKLNIEKLTIIIEDAVMKFQTKFPIIAIFLKYMACAKNKITEKIIQKNNSQALVELSKIAKPNAETNPIKFKMKYNTKLNFRLNCSGIKDCFGKLT